MESCLQESIKTVLDENLFSSLVFCTVQRDGNTKVSNLLRMKVIPPVKPGREASPVFLPHMNNIQLLPPAVSQDPGHHALQVREQLGDGGLVVAGLQVHAQHGCVHGGDGGDGDVGHGDNTGLMFCTGVSHKMSSHTESQPARTEN